MREPLVLVMAGFALLSVVLLAAALAAVRKRRWIGTTMTLMCALLSLALAALAGTLGVAMRGYQALTREVVAATVVTRPTGTARFVATFTFPDGRREQFEITGDALYVDAHIVKWHPRFNILGPTPRTSSTASRGATIGSRTSRRNRGGSSPSRAPHPWTCSRSPGVSPS